MKTAISIVIVIFCLAGASTLAFSQAENSSQRGRLVVETDSLTEVEKGPLFPRTHRPNIEVTLKGNDGAVNQLFPGATMNLSLVVTNTGNATAEKCWVKINANSPFIIVNYAAMDVFNLEVGETKSIDLNVSVFRSAPLGIIKLKVEVDEYNGYNMFPARTINFFINEQPEIDLILMDLAAYDHPGKGYIDKFDDADLYFRLQNCGNETFHNVAASVQLKNGTIARRINPRLEMGNIEPKETRDVEITVSTTMAARNIGLTLLIESDEKTMEHDLFFEFLEDNKAPEDLMPDGCEYYIPDTGTEVYYPEALEKPIQTKQNNNYYAILIGNFSYVFLDDLEYVQTEIHAFRQHLIFTQGIPESNIHLIANTRSTQLQHLFTNIQTTISDLHRSLRRRLGGKELVIYYVGYAAADLHNGEIYLLPSDFTMNDPDKRVKLSDLFKQLEPFRETYNFRSVTTFLNLNYHMVSSVGNKDDTNLLITQLHANQVDYTTFFSSSVYQEGIKSDVSEASSFSDLLIKGLNGLADFNKTTKINASELTRFMSDEFFGVPGLKRINNFSFQVPFFIGADVNLFE